ncbi:MAG: hypothetical protein LC749_00220 [Actinobacteria bacterium]|nr:hypothetical protein [Actinomycetota bacterium]
MHIEEQYAEADTSPDKAAACPARAGRARQLCHVADRHAAGVTSIELTCSDTTE